MKKIIYLVLSIIIIFTLSACTEDEKTDSEILYEVKTALVINGETSLTESVVLPVSDNEDVIITWSSTKPEYLAIDGTVTRPESIDRNQNVSLTAKIQLNDSVVYKYFDFIVLAIEKLDFIELDTNYTDALTMSFAYENTNFIENGIGEVTLNRCVDGDTAFFTENGVTFSVRFLGIDTPESTAQNDPWGKAASIFTCEKLTNATTIVLQYNPSPIRMDNYGRYLAWIWYDGRLLNLELVEEAFTGSKLVTGSVYTETFFDAGIKAQFTDRRIWGEIDPDFDYSLDGIQITIEELVTNIEEYIGKKVVITGIIARVIAGNPYLQDGDYGIYLYHHENTTKFVIGNQVLISGLTPGYYPDEVLGSVQLTGLSRLNIDLLSVGNSVSSLDIEVADLTKDNVGALLNVKNLTVIGVSENPNDDAFTITAEDQFGNIISVRVDKRVADKISVDLFSIGTTFDIVAALGIFEAEYQLYLANFEDVTFK